jgi:bifunctional DNA-binding transcriptional regulator/antitoxin component of YhaV-PrlF toxin-antitoxin module
LGSLIWQTSWNIHEAMKTTVTGKNQVSIPARIARKHGIRPGCQLEWSEGSQPDELIVRVLPPREEAAQRLLGAGRRWLAAGADPVRGLVEERERDELP